MTKHTWKSWNKAEKYWRCLFFQWKIQCFRCTCLALAKLRPLLHRFLERSSVRVFWQTKTSIYYPVFQNSWNEMFLNHAYNLHAFISFSLSQHCRFHEASCPLRLTEDGWDFIHCLHALPIFCVDFLFLHGTMFLSLKHFESWWLSHIMIFNYFCLTDWLCCKQYKRWLDLQSSILIKGKVWATRYSCTWLRCSPPSHWTLTWWWLIICKNLIPRSTGPMWRLGWYSYLPQLPVPVYRHTQKENEHTVSFHFLCASAVQRSESLTMNSQDWVQCRHPAYSQVLIFSCRWLINECLGRAWGRLKTVVTRTSHRPWVWFKGSPPP